MKKPRRNNKKETKTLKPEGIEFPPWSLSSLGVCGLFTAAAPWFLLENINLTVKTE